MFPLTMALWFAQTPIMPAQQEILRPQEMRVLPGSLDSVPVFNSNSPELVLKEGILLSTFPKEGKAFANAHLDRPLSGRFDLFAHHIAKGSAEDLRTLYQGVIVFNPTDDPVTIDVLQAASYVSQPDAPFVEMSSFLENPLGTVYAGPGSRSVNDVLRGKRQDLFPPSITIAPQEYGMLLNLPIEVKTLSPPVNGRSTLMRLRSSGTVYLGSLALFAKKDSSGQERAPNLEEWRELLQSGPLSTPRDKVPTPIEQSKGSLIYGRVAGVAIGSRWQTQVTDPGQKTLAIPQAGGAFSYGISLLHRGRLGTGQNQTAKMEVRYPDTAYQAHGNYGIEYNLTLPLENQSDRDQTVTVALETPLKREDTQEGLRFLNPLPKNVFFRGTVRIRYGDDGGMAKTRYVHLVQRRGQMGEPLATLRMKPKERRLVQVDLIYPPDATPPQVLTVQTRL
jgi:Protein of unknown function (DUF3370)